MRCTAIFLCWSVLGLGLGMLGSAAASAAAPETSMDALAVNRMLGRGINLGNALEAPEVGAWGMEIRPEYIQAIADAGFDSVRVPIRWSAHAQTAAPYTIDPSFLQRVDGILDEALARDLAVVLNFHHYEELYAAPDEELARFLALWRQVAERYQDRPVKLVFELLNEPHGELSHERWQAMFPKVLAVVRESNPDRAVIIGPGQWNNVDELPKLRLPEGDRMLIGTFHYYNPFQFTHQQASWVDEAKNWKDIRWQGTPAELKAIEEDFQKAKIWSEQQQRPVFLGEFGAYSAADMPSRARWTAAIVRAAHQRGFSSAYWEFGSGFGAYDRQAGQWREPLKDALLPAPIATAR